MRVTACNNDGVWNETGATLALKFCPPGGKVGGSKPQHCFFSPRRWRWASLLSRRRLKLKLSAWNTSRRWAGTNANCPRLHDDLGASLTQVGLMVEELKEARG